MSFETTLTIIGNLTADPDLRYSPAGVAMARFTVASTPRSFDRAAGQFKDGEPLFLACTAWRDLADNVAMSLAKGTRVVVTGRLRHSRWETDDGQRHQMLQLDVEEIGPSLRFATAKPVRTSRNSGSGADPRSSATPIRPSSGDPQWAPAA